MRFGYEDDSNLEMGEVKRGRKWISANRTFYMFKGLGEGEYYVLIRIIDLERAKNVKQLLKAHYRRWKVNCTTGFSFFHYWISSPCYFNADQTRMITWRLLKSIRQTCSSFTCLAIKLLMMVLTQKRLRQVRFDQNVKFVVRSKLARSSRTF